jgi:pyruvate formate lyase activating enzyme
LQSEFVLEIFRLCKEIGVNTCLDTSGSIVNDKVRSLLSYTDRVLLDIKFTSDELYLKYIGCSASMPLEFLKILNERNIKTTLRQVIVPTLNDTRENILALKEIKNSHPCVDKIELLPFKKICQTKYDSLGIVFPFKDFPTPTHAKMEELNALL